RLHRERRSASWSTSWTSVSPAHTLPRPMRAGCPARRFTWMAASTSWLDAIGNSRLQIGLTGDGDEALDRKPRPGNKRRRDQGAGQEIFGGGGSIDHRAR